LNQEVPNDKMTASNSFTFPASFAQQRLWFLDQLDPNQSVYNMAYAVRFETPLDLAVLEKCLNEIVRRHESLRTTFAAIDGQPQQIVRKELALSLSIVDLSGLPPEHREAESRKHAALEAGQPFDLSKGPLLRATLLRLGEQNNVLLLVMHHIVSDGWSMGILLRELAVLYEAFSLGREPSLPELPVQYADYAVWQRELLQGEVIDEQISFWREHLQGAPTALQLASDRTRPPLQTFKGARRYTELPAALSDRLRDLSRREGVTLFMTLLAAFDVLLWRFSGQTDIVVGTPIAGRNRSELEDLIGFFANTLPLRVTLSGNPSFRDLLARVRELALEAYSHQDVPFDRLVEELKPERSLSHTPLFQVIFAFENTPQPQRASGLSMNWLEVDRGTSRCDLSLFATDKGAELGCMWEYSTDLFDAETIAQMMSSYGTLLESILERPEDKIGYLEIWTEAERRRLIEPAVEVAPEKTGSRPCMQQLFEDQAEQRPDAVAVVCGEQRVTYRELNARANGLARYLQELEVGPEVTVGVCMERSVDSIVALLGILKAGGAYVPVDPAYPSERVAFMLADSQVPVLLTQRHLLATLPSLSAQVVCVDDEARFTTAAGKDEPHNVKSAVTSENLAYVIYTSGSTGRPKGVQVKHETVVHLFAATREELGFRAGDVWSVVHSTAFDFSVWEIWGCLLQGGTLVVAPLEIVQSPSEFFALLCREQVTVLNQTPAALRDLLAARERAGPSGSDWKVRVIVCGGDAMDQELAVQLAQLDVPVWNFYGPTESTVWTTFGLVAQPSVAQTSVCDSADTMLSASETQTEAGTALNSIGHRIKGLEVYLLDQQLQLAPFGVAAELFIGGAGLARGYFNRPELTAEKFIPHPWSAASGARLYRTGDLVRRRRNGRLEFAGRIDHQVKVRGFRVELGEIETALAQHPDVDQAVVIVREDRPGDKRLVAYLVLQTGAAPGLAELRNFLQLSLPEYMVPAAFVQLAALPLTPNQKVDRQRLPAPDYATAQQTVRFVAPRTPVEEMVADIWGRVLGVARIGVDDNFFELGGHSLLATQVISRLHDTFQIELPLRALFEQPTVAGLAEKLEEARSREQGLQPPPLRAVAKSGRLPLSFAQQRLWFLDQLEPGSPFYNIARGFRLQGLLDTNALAQALTEIMRRHESLRTVFGAEQGTPFQEIVPVAAVPLPIDDLKDLSAEAKEREAQRLGTEEIKRPFNLAGDLLLRARLLRLGDDDHVLLLTMHHIAADGWSLGVLFRELSELYDSYLSANPPALAALPIQYADYAMWQREWLQGEVLQGLVSYWRNQLAGAPSQLALPTDHPRPPVQSFRGAGESLELSLDLTDELKELSRREGVTLFMTCLAAFQLLLGRFSGQSDLIIGTDVANRNRVETEGLIGFFTNLLPLRARLSGELKFADLLRQVRETTLDAYAHQALPFEKLVEELRPARDLGRNPLVQVLLVMQNQPALQLEMSQLETSRFELPLESSRFDLVLFLSERAEGLAGFWLYNPDLFEPRTIERLSSEYAKLSRGIIKDPAAPLDSYEVFREERNRREMEKDQQQQSQIDRLRGRRRKGVDLSRLSGVSTRTLTADQPLPLVIEPENAALELTEWAGANQSFINENLLKHGAILFRGFDVDSVDKFEEFAAVICPELFGEYGDLPRAGRGGKVYGSTPYPADETILFHNESSHMHRWPMLIWFYCVTAASTGGESPIIDCRRIYDMMDPAIRERFERQGLMYVRNFTDGLDVSWQKFFQTDDKATVEDYCRRAGMEFEWRANNGLRTRQLCPAVVSHPQTGELAFFNQLQLHHVSCLAPAVRESLRSMMSEADLPRNVYYGDGSPIPDAVMTYLGDLYARLAVSFPWRARDVLMLNNMLVAHSRNPFVGQREIVVALGNLISKDEV
jgi:amino acid adenylation domain-containing protein